MNQQTNIYAQAVNYSVRILVTENEGAVFQGINNIKGWWTVVMEGRSEQVNDVFTVRFGETFIKIRVTESIPGKKIGWEVVDGFKHWISNHGEWIGTSMTWEISGGKEGTTVTFTHIGLVPGMECYEGCEMAWNGYIRKSLYNLLEEGVGNPDLK